MRHSPQPGAGNNARSRQHNSDLGRREFGRQSRRRQRDSAADVAYFRSKLFQSLGQQPAIGQNVFAAIADEQNFTGARWERGQAVRLVKESSERLVGDKLLPCVAEQAYGYVVREIVKHHSEEHRRMGRGVGMKKVVVKLVSGTEIVTDPYNLQRVTTLDLLAACASDEG